MSAGAGMLVLAAALVTGSPAAGSLAGVPIYPGGTAVRVAGSTLITTSDPLEKVKTGYTALFRKAGWEPSAPDSVLNGDVPGAGKADLEALSKAVTYMSFERQDQVADLFLLPGKDRHHKPITLITILSGPKPEQPEQKTGNTRQKGVTGGRP